MKVFTLKKDKTNPVSDPYLYERLNSDMNYCGLKPEIQKGFLFFLGASINIGINESPVDISPSNNAAKNLLPKDAFGYF